MRAIAAKELIERRYALIHGAVPSANFPHFCVVDGESRGLAKAALGFRLASVERLFLEDYLGEPVERAVSRCFQRTIERDRIVEIGAHASDASRATIALWARTARHLDGIADVAVAVLTRPLRSMFERLHIPIMEICDADPAKLAGGGQEWGRYYDQQPRVCAGLIAPARPLLAGFDDGLPGVCA